MDLEQRLQEEIGKKIWSQETINRVRKVVKSTYKNTPYRYFEEIEDYQLYYELHTEWREKSTSEMHRDKESGAKAFYVSFISWTNKQTEDEKERKRLRQTIFKPKQKWIEYSTIDDWITEYNTHPEWKDKSTIEMARDKESGAQAFYQAFHRWTNRQTEEKNERKKLKRKVFPNLR